MLDIKRIRTDFDAVAEKLATRGVDATVLNEMKEIDAKRRDILVKVETLKAERNTVSAEIAQAKRNKENADDKIAAMQTLSAEVKALDAELAEIEHDLSIIMIVGEKMKSHIGVTATATRALSENKINIQMMSQGSSEVSIMFVVHKDQEKAAIKALYNAFFGESKED